MDISEMLNSEMWNWVGNVWFAKWTIEQMNVEHAHLIFGGVFQISQFHTTWYSRKWINLAEYFSGPSEEWFPPQNLHVKWKVLVV